MNEEIEINVRKLRPFTRFIYTIGELPTSYLISMTYEEQLIWLCNYLEKTVIPAINNNAQAVEELQNLFIELQEYVNNYFENLDVQEEINNKLDDMAESGELEDIISQYIELATTYVYNNVSEMKEATNLVDGSFARTSGFYSYNDGGGATYKIRTVTVEDTVDEKTLIAITETLVAELIKEKEMDVKEFGAKGDGETDDTLSIQTALDYCKNIIIKDGTYMIDSVDNNLSPQSNSHIKLVNATLKAITNDDDNYAVLRIYQKENIVIEGGIIEGDKSTHTGATGQWGHCIIVRESENITIKNITLKNAWGDGLYVVDSANINTYNVVADGNRRNGYSIISCDGFSSNNDYIANTDGTAPEAGVDIEPNEATEVLKNIVFNNLKTYNNGGAGIDIHLSQQTNDTPNINIVVNNYYDEGSGVGIQIYKNQYTKGKILINNPYLLNNYGVGINLRQCYDSNLQVEIEKPKIINCNTSNNSTPKYGSGIVLFLDDNDTDLALGNVAIKEPYITNYRNDQRYLYIVGSSTYHVENFKLINPVNNDNEKQLTINNVNDLVFTDLYNQFIVNSNNNLEIAGYNTKSKLINTAYTTSRTNTILGGFPTGREMTFINTSPSGYDINIKLPSGCYLRGFTSNEAPTINIPDIGNSVTIKRLSDTDFIVLNYVGNITAS